MDVVDNNDFLLMFLYLVVENNTSLDFTWMLWIIMTSLMFFMYLLWKTRFTFYMNVVDNNDFLFMYLVVENNI